jgi:hypothetical protein
MNVQSEDRPIDSAVFIVLLTGAAYAGAFGYEAAYLRHFGVPLHMADVELKALLVCFLGMVSFLIVLQAILQWWPRRWPVALNIAILNSALFVTLIVATGIVFSFRWIGWSVLTAITMLWVWSEFYAPSRHFPDKLAYVDRLEATRKAQLKRESALDWISDQFGRRRSLAVIGAILLFFGTSLAGAFHAARERYFLVSGDCIILRVRGDLALCAKLSDAKLNGEIEFVSIEGMRARLTRLGPLETFDARKTGSQLEPAGT